MFYLPSKWFAVVLLASLTGLHPLRTQAADAVLTQVKDVLTLTEEIASYKVSAYKLYVPLQTRAPFQSSSVIT
jgi:hypothetical protein